MKIEDDGAQGRSEATANNHLLSGCQPRLLTNGGPPSPAGEVSNLTDPFAEMVAARYPRLARVYGYGGAKA